VVYQHVQDIPVPPSETSDAAPPELDGLVMRSLAKDPDDRFQTAEEMRGLVQYGLQMLHEQGSHTGTWNTGPVDIAGMHEGGSTPAMGVAGGAAMQHPGDSGTAQIPGAMLRPPGGDDGGFEGGHRDGNGRGGRGKMWIFAVLAVIAIAVGVAFALSANGDKNKEKDTPTKAPTKQSETKKPSKSPDEDTSDDATQPGDGSGGQDDYTPPPQNTTGPTAPTSPTESQPTDDASEPTDDASEPTDDASEPTDDPPVTESEEPPVTGGTDGGDVGGNEGDG
jgi:hypothetical protein